MGHDLLDGPRAKITRAEQHLESLKTEIREWLTGRERQAERVREEVDPKTGERVLRLTITEPAPVVEWACIVGDCVHNLRSSLDQLVADLCITNGQPVDGFSAFPVYFDGLSFWKKSKGVAAGLKKVAGVSFAAAIFIEALQPYWHVEDPSLHHLAVLGDLSNQDKHRGITVLVPSARAEGLNLSGTAEYVHVGKLDEPIPMEDGAEVLRMKVGPGEHVNVEVAFGQEVLLAEGAASGQLAQHVLRELIDYTGSVVEFCAEALF